MSLRTLSILVMGTWIIFPNTASAQVFDPAPGNGPDQAYYGNWGTNADAENPAPNSYDNYRKWVDNGRNVIQTAENDPDDPTLATWRDLSQVGGDGDGLRPPGVFIGNSPSPRSYEDNVLFLGGVFDIEGTGMAGDLAMRTNWGLRFGFIEDPDEFVGQRAPNDETWDLWAADFGTDGVYLQMFAQATTDVSQSPIGSTDQYVRAQNEVLLQGGGAPDAAFRDERDRAKFGTGLQTSPLTSFSVEGEIEGIRNWISTGVAYEGRLQIEWWMEPTNPGADPNTVEGREVTFNLTAGEALFTQTFDPGDANNPVIPNPTTDPENPFDDGFFDWQNATPIMYIGAGGGTLLGGTGQMGFFSPNPPTVGCDFDSSGVCDLADLDDLMYTGLSSGDLKYDLDSSGAVDIGDRDAFLVEIGSLPGDADLNGVNNANDLNALGTNWQSSVTSWSQGDFNGDAFDDASDLNVLGTWWQKTAADFAAAQNGRATTAPVPEPNGSLMALVALMILSMVRRRCR